MAETKLPANNPLADIKSLLDMFGGSGTKTTDSPTTSTTQSNLTSEQVQALLQQALGGSAGLASITGAQKSAGLYNSSTNTQLTGDLLARIATEVAAKSAGTTTTTSGGTRTTQNQTPLSGGNIGNTALTFLGAQLFGPSLKKIASNTGLSDIGEKLAGALPSFASEAGATVAPNVFTGGLAGSGMGDLAASTLPSWDFGSNVFDFGSSIAADVGTSAAADIGSSFSSSLWEDFLPFADGGLVRKTAKTDEQDVYSLGNGLTDITPANAVYGDTAKNAAAVNAFGVSLAGMLASALAGPMAGLAVTGGATMAGNPSFTGFAAREVASGLAGLFGGSDNLGTDSSGVRGNDAGVTGDGLDAAGNDTGTATAANGGKVSGPGTGTSDSIKAKLSNGEFVISADVVDKLGPEFFQKLQDLFHQPVATGR